MAVLMKNIASYQQTKPVYDGMIITKDKVAYKQEHESELIIYEAAVRALKKHAGDGGRLPNPASLRAEYERLMKKKNSLREEYDALKRQAREYVVVKRNVDCILNPGVERTLRKDRSVEL